MIIHTHSRLRCSSSSNMDWQMETVNKDSIGVGGRNDGDGGGDVSGVEDYTSAAEDTAALEALEVVANVADGDTGNGGKKDGKDDE